MNKDVAIGFCRISHHCNKWVVAPMKQKAGHFFHYLKKAIAYLTNFSLKDMVVD
jgi:hypothetical protein